MQMKPSDATVAVRSKVIFFTHLLFLSGCMASTTTLSERFNVCMTSSHNVSLHAMRMGSDFDYGSIEIKKIRVNVYVGWHPDASHSAKRKAIDATEAFRFLSRERADGVEKILFGKNRGDRRGPIFVLFEAKNLDAVESTLLANDLLIDCKGTR
jgi:hypothetical protein